MPACIDWNNNTTDVRFKVKQVKQLRGRLDLMCVHEPTQGSSAKPQLNRTKECEEKKKKPSLAPLCSLPAWKRPDDNNVAYGASVSSADPSSPLLSPPSIPPPPLVFERPPHVYGSCLWYDNGCSI